MVLLFYTDSCQSILHISPGILHGHRLTRRIYVNTQKNSKRRFNHKIKHINTNWAYITLTVLFWQTGASMHRPTRNSYNKEYLILHHQYHVCWWPGHIRRQVISIHDNEVVIRKYQSRRIKDKIKRGIQTERVPQWYILLWITCKLNSTLLNNAVTKI